MTVHIPPCSLYLGGKTSCADEGCHASEGGVWLPSRSTCGPKCSETISFCWILAGPGDRKDLTAIPDFQASFVASVAPEFHMSESGFGNTGGKRRRAERFRLRTPLLVSWTDSNGKRQQASGTTRVVSAFGALLIVDNCPPDGCQVQLTNLDSEAVATARVIWSGTSATEDVYSLGIELAALNPDFWPGS